MKTAPTPAFNATPEERELIRKIAERAHDFCKENLIAFDYLSTRMDLTACHSNGTPLDFEKLLAADDANFGHDLLGIRWHINRNTGELGGCFLPRCAKAEGAQ